MSRLGKQPIEIPKDVTATFAGGIFTVKGPKGELAKAMRDDVLVSIEGSKVTLAPKEGSELAPALWGTYAAHAHNMIEGVTKGFKKELEIEGVGYRAAVQGANITLSVGFSHPVVLAIPAGITVEVEKGLIRISGANKDAVGQFAADVRGAKPPEPYKGKGIHYVGEYIIRKQGKKAV